ncbi:MAG: hypothetical protein AB7K64_18555 [Variibacter sp.]|jgi:hypothetical protein
MGIVIQFPEARRAAWTTGSVPIENVGAPVVILPVIRIERHTEDIDIGFTPEEEPPTGSGRRRNRRG